MQWYYIVDGEQKGPIEQDEFFELARSGVVKPADYVWSPSMGDQWTEASKVPGLFATQAAPQKRLQLRKTDEEKTDEKKADDQLQQASRDARREADAVFAAAQVRVDDIPLTCTGLVRPSIDRMKDILFRPFVLGKWFVLGFSAWLATLGENGGGSKSSFNKDSGDTGGGAEISSDIIGAVNNVLSEYGGIIAIIVTVGVIVMIAVFLLVMWLRCRGKFMLLDNVINNRAEVAGPWGVFKQHGNSLFKWNIVYGILCVLALLPILAILIFKVAIPCMQMGEFDPAMLTPVIVAGILYLPLMIVMGYIARFREDFIIPIMYNMDLTAMEAWGRFLPVFRQRMGAFLFYGLFYALLCIGAVICIALFGLATCCIGLCLMVIPYIGAVVLLPVTVFFRIYSLEYLKQFGALFGQPSGE